MLSIKKNECILDISLDMCIFLSEIATVDHLQHICDVHCLTALMRLMILSVSGTYTCL